MKETSRGAPSDEDDDLVRLLRQTGMRSDPPPDRAARVRAVVLDECRAAARGRVLRRRAIIGAALLASAATAMVTVRLATRHQVPAPAAPVVAATIERVAGESRRFVRDSNGAVASVPLSLRDDRVVMVGDAIETSESGRLGLRLADAASIRLDRDSRVTFRSTSDVELERGGIYIDNTDETHRLSIHTALGIVRDIGTQFEVRLTGNSLRVRVRSGLVEVRRGGDLVTARPATEVTLASSDLSDRPIALHGPDWDWIVDLAAPMTIEGRALSTVLVQLCREHGWTLRYADESLARRASAIVLRGSVEGLSPDETLRVVIETSGLAYRLADGELLVLRSQGP